MIITSASGNSSVWSKVCFSDIENIGNSDVGVLAGA